MKKLFACLLAPVLCLALFAGCGSTPASTPDDNTDTPDTSETVTPAATTGIDFALPEGFTEVEAEDYRLWIPPTYPDDSSNVNLMTAEPGTDAEFMAQDEAAYKAAVEAVYKDAGYDLTVTVDSMEYSEMDGYKVLRIDSHYVLNDVSIAQIILSVNADVLYNITYTETNDAGWLEAFGESASNAALTY